MSGTCLMKRGKQCSCSECGRKGLKVDMDSCPYCGEQIVMRWDVDNDRKLQEDTPDAAR